MTIEEAKLHAARVEMVNHQLRARGISDKAVLQAFMDVPRDRFLPPELAEQAYEDRPVPIGHGQTISQPFVVALMLQELAPGRRHRVLDVGAGSGYQTALLSRLCGRVLAIERIEELAERAMSVLAELNVTNVTIVTGDGSLGYPSEAPFDRIICGAGAPNVPQAWIDQLADGGRIVAPVGSMEVQTLLAVEKHGRKIARRVLCDVRFVRLLGKHGWPD